MPLKLRRNRSNGVIYNDIPGAPIVVLRGGHCHLFDEKVGDRYWTQASMPFEVCFPTSEPNNRDGCERDHASPTLTLVRWEGDFAGVIGKLVENGCNLVRVFLSDGVFLSGGRITSLHPYARVNGKWRIAAATRGDASAWSAAYFTRLRDFVQAADDCDVAVQLCLFTHHDLTSVDTGPGHAYWPMSFWNPANADDGRDLVTIRTAGLDGGLEPPHPDVDPAEERREEGLKARLRNQDFLNVERAGLMAVQRAFVVKVLETVCPLGNVILELNNEPRLLGTQEHPALPSPGVYQARWLDTATGWILGWLAAQPVAWRPLISANATPPFGTLSHDVDSWAGLPLPSCYRELDAISYHGLTGYRDVPDPSRAHCGMAALPAVDRASIQQRVTEHRGKHNDKSLICSTDAVRGFAQNYPAAGGGTAELLRRDGQVCTLLDYEPDAAMPHVERVQADLDNWAYGVLRHGFGRTGPDPRPGSVHFQNHSTIERSFQAIGLAVAKAQSLPSPARNAGRWGPRFARTSGGAGNFWWAHRFNPATGEVVNQLGTRDAPQAAGAQGASSIGWRYDITPATTSRFGFEADYEVVSVSDREQGARVAPRVAVTLFAVDAAGALGAQLGRAERALAPGAAPGTLVLMADLAVGRRYAAVLSGEVGISYANGAQGYGETILRFPEMRLCGVA